MATTSGLRERKKQATRQRISDIATRMFVERGFDAVTVAEIAEAAEVSKMTVFNYFPRKEDLVVDREPELLALVRAGMAARQPIAGLRAMFVQMVEQGHPLMGAVEHAPVFWALLHSSPVLIARAAALEAALEQEIDGQLRRAGAPPGDAMLAAAMITSAWRAIWRDGIRRVDAGDALAAIRTGQKQLLERAFDAVEASFPRGPKPHRKRLKSRERR
jgi:AcrR family transcriptional regulator